MFDVLKQESTLKKSQISRALYCKKLQRDKSRGVFRTQASIYDWGFLWIYLTAYYFAIKAPS